MMMNNIKKTILITLALLITNSCSGLFNIKREGHFTSQMSLNNTKLTPTITHDMVNFIQNYYPTSKTTFYIQLDSSAYTEGVDIEDALRNVGYGISYIKKRGQIPFAYKIDFINKSIMRTTYNIGKSTLSRLYNIEEGNISPRSAFTTRGFTKPIYSISHKKDYQKTNILKEETYTLESNLETTYIDEDLTENIQKALITIPVLNIRDTPSKNGVIVGKYRKNSLVYIDSTIINNKGEEWCKVIQKDSKNNQHQYISSRYIKYLN